MTIAGIFPVLPFFATESDGTLSVATKPVAGLPSIVKILPCRGTESIIGFSTNYYYQELSESSCAGIPARPTHYRR